MRCSAYKRLLELDPNDRRAQEQLKKRWVATGAWDELEDVLLRRPTRSTS